MSRLATLQEQKPKDNIILLFIVYHIIADGERKSSCGVCGARLGPGVAQAHFLQELQHLYSLSALPRDASLASHTMHHQDEDARWEVCFTKLNYKFYITVKFLNQKQQNKIK